MDRLNFLKKSKCFYPLLFFFIFTQCKEAHKVYSISLDREVFRKADLSGVTDLKVEKHNDVVFLSSRKKEEFENLKEQVHEISHSLGRCGGYVAETKEDFIKTQKSIDFQSLRNKRDLEDTSKWEIIYKEETGELLKSLNKEKIKESIEVLSQFETRSSTASEPNKPIEKFKQHIEKILKDSDLVYSVSRIEHQNTRQNSIKVRIEGSRAPDEVLVLGGHIDSITNSWFSKEAPGVDDNASGSAVVLEVLRAIAYSKWRPMRTIEFFWYAAEEKGLLGSKEIAEEYQEKEVKVLGVMQLDMVLFPGLGETIGITEDYTNKGLNTLIENLVTTYLKIPTKRYRCGYGCSDHASWYRSKFRTVFPFESTMGNHNKNIHTKRDVLDNRTSLEHALRFAKLAFAFLLETSDYNRASIGLLD